ncbi:MAG TPA: hypothetical protein VN442_13365 [Bryobacteraceae bacterium]|nr:hypothetical protein [Bryobacteraceae bacterium]
MSIDNSSFMRSLRFAIKTISAKAGMVLILISLMWVPLLAQQSPPGSSERVARTLYFRLKTSWIEPAEITVPPGAYNIRVFNGLVKGDMAFSIQGEQGARVLDVNLAKVSSRKSAPVVLTTGKHTLSVGNRAAWRATIIVSPVKN